MILLMRIIFVFVNIIIVTYTRILAFIYRKKPPSIPPITSSLYTLSATTLAKRIRQREVTSYEVVKAYVDRIKLVNPYLNAVIEDRFEAALNDAKLCDEQLQSGEYDVETLEREKPLFGIPITVKECCSVKGLSLTGCTLARRGMKAEKDGFIVEMLRNAGAIPLCVTNTPEMSSSVDTNNLLFGRTCNAYDTRYSAAGSSGGEGALVGAGASLIGIGSDIGGSIRIPAFWNGHFGIKCTPGLISNEGHFPLSDEDKSAYSYLCVGPLTRYVEDLHLVMKVATAKCGRDLRLDVPVDLKQLKVYYRQSMDKTCGILPVTPEIKQCVLKAANHFSQSGVHVEKLPIEWPTTMPEIILILFTKMENPPQILIDVNDSKLQKNPLTEMAKAVFGRSQHTKAMLLFAAAIEKCPFPESVKSHYIQRGQAVRQKLLNLLGEDGVFFYPTFRIPTTFSPVSHGEMWNSLAYSAVPNVFGFPSVHVTMGLNRDGLPIGFQVIAAPYQDRLCIAVARELERAFGGWIQPSVPIHN